MAHLLGSQSCMDSLRKDITDLQGAIVDVFSRAGAVRFPSWKYPDQVSCDLDLVSLLEHYDHVEGNPEFTQLSHVVLLELVIDRLLLLLQSFTSYTDNITSNELIPMPREVGPCMSIGLTVRRYWTSMLRLGQLYRQSLTEKTKQEDSPVLLDQSEAAENHHPVSPKPKASRGGENEATEAPTLSPPASCSVTPEFPDPCSAKDTSPPGHLASAASPAATCSVHAQTIDTALIPCDACGSVQRSLWEVSKAIISLCASQNLPSSLGKFQHLLQETMGLQPMSALDLSYWAAEQSKDLSRINKHLAALLQAVSPMRVQLEEAERLKQQLEQQVEELGRELQEERAEQQQRQLDAQQHWAGKEQEQEQALAQLEGEKQALLSETTLLKKTVDTLMEELKQNRDTVQDLEAKKQQMLEDMNHMVKKSEVKQLEARVQLLTGRLENASQQFGWASTELDKEKAKVDSMIRHQESLQAKQRALLQQLDSLDREREELRTSLEEAEMQQANLESQLQAVCGDKEHVEVQLKAQQELLQSLQQEKQDLERVTEDLQVTICKLNKSIQELKERERLLVAFPDLHVPSQAQFESSGNVAEDMERQVQANDIRIRVLEEENGRLRATLAKLKEVAQQGGLKLVPEAQLWSSPSKGTQTGTISHSRRPSPGHLSSSGARRERPASTRPSSESSLSGRASRLPPGRPSALPAQKCPRSPLTITGSSKASGSTSIAYMELRGKGSGKHNLAGSAHQLR
ncbi:coiled-coil domain-containing protein 157 isoform X1 [Dromiciops gliroides]|uniref:coiled-coil domain-containing protein 157 isoform X1 n=3 Tax=Dromiciops gliroides TaxID=33562 RepID=UPI001CC810B3|nr:coiled-coil domain-containing protein 157 isoform X1 [Dromiciops gliroides]XP_043831669.1 coiled-coil domain-containing protein 157 isoform X1 [Dromiciops gliroides]